MWTALKLTISPSSRVSFDEITSCILGKPEHGQYVKALTLHAALAPLTQEMLLDLMQKIVSRFKRTLALITNPTSLAQCLYLSTNFLFPFTHLPYLIRIRLFRI